MSNHGARSGSFARSHEGRADSHPLRNDPSRLAARPEAPLHQQSAIGNAPAQAPPHAPRAEGGNEVR